MKKIKLQLICLLIACLGIISLLINACGSTPTIPILVTVTPTPILLTVTNTPNSTPLTTTVTGTPTNTFTITATPANTGTPCFTATYTLTGTPPPWPTYSVSGSVNYTGTGTMDSAHPIYVGNTNATATQPGAFCTLTTSTTYVLGSTTLGTYNLGAFYDLNGLTPFFVTTWNGYPLHFPHVPGMRYTSSGSCATPVSITTQPVVISGAAGTTTTGPSLTFDNTCSYWGIYGTATYTGTRGTLGLCRQIYIQTFSDAAYSSPLQYTFQIWQNGGHYYIVTNDDLNATGLTPLYVRVFFDANGDGVLNTGDPYLNLGQLTPTANGLLENISFGDTNIK